MRALVATGDARLVAPTAGGVRIDVEAISVNRGELHRLQAAPAGRRPGWDFVGRVTGEASPLPSGTRVCGMLAKAAWASQIVAPMDYLTPVPETADALAAAALPVAGVTAVRVLRLAGDLAGRRVLIRGAASGVGRFAVQLARLLGAVVHAHVGRPERSRGLAGLGAHQVWCGQSLPAEPMDLILDTTGGTSLEHSCQLVAGRGLIVTFGNSAQADSVFPVSAFYPKQARVCGYHLLRDIRDEPPAAHLAWLVDLVSRGNLQVDRGPQVPWKRMPQVLADLRERQVAGKAVLTVTDRRPISAPQS